MIRSYHLFVDDMENPEDFTPLQKKQTVGESRKVFPGAWT